LAHLIWGVADQHTTTHGMWNPLELLNDTKGQLQGCW